MRRSCQCRGQEQVQVKNETLVFARVFKDEYVIVALNSTDKEQHLYFDYRGESHDIVLPPHGSKILK